MLRPNMSYLPWWAPLPIGLPAAIRRGIEGRLGLRHKSERIRVEAEKMERLTRTKGGHRAA